MTRLVPYTPEYLAGFRAEAYQIELPDSWIEARERVISDNGFYSPYVRSAEEVHIIGRIRWFAREI